jgi:DNA gyrase subunit A
MADINTPSGSDSDPQNPDQTTPPGALPEAKEVSFTLGKTIDQAIATELGDSYLTYAMSTIVDRALPDVRDGLKPSQRRILVSMHDLKLTPGKKHIKCAKICGMTSGDYHPHGEAVVYPTLVGMAQTWRMRMPLVDPQGNFGSIDPDPPAAMRYTEARMAGPAGDMLEDLEYDTVDWKDNYDGSKQEPTVLPSKFPNLLINGGVGIAVGMATCLAPHNPGEIFDALVATIDNPDITIQELFSIVPGPDFPTGAFICGRRGILDAYSTGRGRVVIRAKLHHEETRSGRNIIVVTELPYQVSKSDGVIGKIKEAVREERLTEISNIIDESSNRSGMRLVIELKKGADPQVVENQLYQLTPLQSGYSINNIALVKGRPQTLTLKEMLKLHIEHRFEVIRRKTAFLLRQASREAHRIEGLIYAVCDIQEVIDLIRSCKTRDEAIEKLMIRGFRIPPTHPYAPQIPERLLAQSRDNPAMLSRAQAEAIGRLQLIQLTSIEIDKLVSEYNSLAEKISEYEEILAKDEKVYALIRAEVLGLKDKYAGQSKRRTQIIDAVGDLDIGDLTPVETVAVTISHGGYVKRLPVEQFRTQGRGGKGIIGADFKDEDYTETVFVASTHDDLLCFTNTGRVFKMKVYEIPESARTSRGRNIVNLLELREGEKICQYMPIEDFEKEEAFIFFVTSNAVAKRTSLREFRNVNRKGINAINLREGDSLIGVTWTSGEDHILLGTKTGMSIRFEEGDVRAMGRAATGVNAIDLAQGDQVVGLVRVHGIDDDHDLLTVCVNGYGKRTSVKEYLVQQENGTYRVQSRGGKGRRDIETSERNGHVVAVLGVKSEHDLMVITTRGKLIRINAGTVRQVGRGSQGVRVINFGEGDTVAGVALIRDVAPIPDQAPADPAAPAAPAAQPPKTDAPDNTPPGTDPTQA